MWELGFNVYDQYTSTHTSKNIARGSIIPFEDLGLYHFNYCIDYVRDPTA